jgi:siderophore synthetase component
MSLSDNQLIFSQNKSIGKLSLRRFELNNDSELLHSWVSLPYAEFWGLKDASLEEVKENYRGILSNGHSQVFLGFVDNTASFLLELYNPKYEPIGKHYDPKMGDQGMHILIAPAENIITNFTFDIFTYIMDYMFSNPSTQRIVVEPDSNNHKIHLINKRAGFQHIKEIDLSHKKAYLGFCSRDQFTASKLMAMKKSFAHNRVHDNPSLAVSHINEVNWQQANRQHVCKAISEFSHERILFPEMSGCSDTIKHYYLIADENTEYRFNAKILQLNHWSIDSESIEKYVDNKLEPLDSIKFIIEFQQALAINADMLPTYLEEISSTLCSSAYKLATERYNAHQLTKASFQQVETSMTEGHPSFVANNGRIGFDSSDFQSYAPEAANPIRLLWLATHKRRTRFSAAIDYTYESLIEQEFDLTTRKHFEEIIYQQGLIVDDYLLMPVHPWQWFNKLAHVYAADVASKDIVCLGYGDDHYLAQQSIRTFFNISNPEKHYIKTALSILNMGFMRGLSSYYMRTTPAINDWLNQLILNDEYLQQKGFSILREVAAIGYSNPYFENSKVKDSPYKKMLASLWRESPVSRLKENQRLMTMAALIHKDVSGRALVANMIDSSGLTVEFWMTKYLEVYLAPLLHCYYQHSLVFMPHGENLILIFDNNIPHKALMKDIGEEICLLNTGIELPEDVQRISIKMPEEIETLSIFTDVFDGFFRYLSEILLQQCNFSEDEFWQLVANCIHGYQNQHRNNPELVNKFKQRDIFQSEFAHSCLNRLQLNNNQQMVDLSDPGNSLKFSGTLINPIAKFKANNEIDFIYQSLRHPEKESV